MKLSIPKLSVVLAAALLVFSFTLSIKAVANEINVGSSVKHVFNLDISSKSTSSSGLGYSRVLNKIKHSVTPQISSFTPTSGTSGTTVTITGKNFTGATGVYFGSIEAKSFTVVSDNTITAVVDSGGSGNISVVTSDGLGSLAGFTYLTNSGRNILVIAADNTSARYKDVQSKLISTGLFSSVSVFDANATTPTLDTLIKYGAVLVYSVNGYANSATMGNVLASYISAGGGVVSATYNFGQYTPIGGAFANNYEVFTPGANVSGSATLGAILLASHSTVSGISNFTGGSSSPREKISTLTSGAYTVADWSDGLPLIGVKDNVGPSNAKRVDLNFFPPSSDVYSSGWNSSTQGALLMSNALLYVYNNPAFKQPTITSFSPTKASSSDTVTIKGTDLSGIATVTFGGFASPLFTVVNDSTITAIVGRAASGSVVVTSPGGADTLTGFTYVKQAPSVTSFTPTSTGDGNYVTIIGTGFTGTTAVSFGGVPSTSFYVYADTLLYAYVGAGASGAVSVSTPDGNAVLSGFTYLASPVITSFAPTSAAKGTAVTITGSGFLKATNVYFGGTSATFSIVNDSTITAVVGAGQTGSVYVYSAVGSGSLGGFTYLAPVPVITSFSPTTASSGGYVFVYGTGFTGATSVSFGGVAATTFYVYSDTYLYAYVGSGASGSVSVTTSGGTATLAGFTYVAPPVVKSFSPTSASEGTTVTIKGIGFTNATSVAFGGTYASGYSVINDSTITAIVNTGATGSVQVYNSYGSGSLSGFTYIAPVPVITSFSPVKGGTGSYVTIYGTGLSGATSVTFGGVPASSFYVYSDTYLYAYVGSGASGSVSVTTSGGTAKLVGFTYVASPVVKSFSPVSAATGKTITILGSGFLNATNVSFGSTYASSYSILNDSTITAVVSTGATGSVQVYSTYGSGTLAGFTYIAPVPVITSFTPTSGGSGTYVTVYGTGLSGATSVTFGGVPASSFYVYSDTYLYAYVGSGGASGSVSVTTSGGTASLAGFTYHSAPKITSFSPTSATKGATVTIYGSGFTNAYGVYFGGTNASSYSVLNDSTITAIVGTGASGNVEVDGSYGYGFLGGFTYIAPVPVITSFSPTSSGTGRAVYIYGTGLTGATSVTFGGIPATSFYVNSDTYIYAYVGSGASGSVSVTTSGGTATLAGFTYLPAPVIASFSPASATKGTTVTIIGKGFTNATYVYFGGTYAASYSVVNDSTITAVVGAGTTGSISVYTSAGSGTLGGFTYIAPVPVVTSFSPTSSGKGGYVYVYGTGFTGATSVTFGGVPASSFYVYSDTYLYAYVGTGASGNVSVTTSGGTGSLGGFTFIAPATVTSFAPTTATKGNIITITGSGFLYANSVSFGGTNATNFTIIDDSTLTAIVGAGTSGNVSVTTSGGTGSLSGFTYVAPVPVITSFSPTSAGKGGYVYIYGSGFTGATSVIFGGVPATSFYVYSDTYLYAYVGSGASGSVSVTTSGGTGNLAGFIYLPPPSITSFSPTTATQGDTITIIGSGFTNTNYVYFGGTYAASYKVINDNTIKAVVGGGKSGNVSVNTSVGTGVLSGFTYIAPVPTITSFSPTSSAKGNYVYIYGTGFTGATSVTFGGVPASSFYVSSDTYMYAYVGNGATGSVSVTTPGGTATLKGFIYATAPNITSFYPTTATRGDTVTIYGTSFSGTTSVYFGGTNASSYTVVDDKTIKAVVGSGYTGSITVYNPAGSSVIAGFVYTTPPPLVSSFSPTSAVSGSYVYISGAGFTGATAVTFGGVPASSFYVYSDTYMYAYVGNGASGSVSVTTANGTGSLAGFVYAVIPTITSFSPTTATRGDSVTIHGTGLSGATYVYFGGTNAYSYIVVNDSTISAVVGAGTSGSISVYNAAGSASKAGFTYKVPAPVVTSFSPTSAAKGNYVYVYGTGLLNATKVSFGGVAATSFYVYSDTYLYAYVGSGASGSVSVTTAAGTGSLAGFTYLTVPVITSFSPKTASKGDTVTIAGIGFTNATYVYFGSSYAGSYTVLNDSTIKAVVGAGASGSVSVSNSIGSNSLSGFIYKAPVPTITSFSPTAATKGTYVSVYGNGFTGATAVSFGGVPAASFYVSNDTYLYAYVGNGASGSVSVTTPGGTASLAGFTYTGAPIITAFTPKAGVNGSAVTITGHAFSNAISVFFGGDSALSYTVVNDSTIKAVVGIGASGSVGVTTNYGTGTLAGFSYCKPSLDTIRITACGSYTWHKVTYLKSGNYNFDTLSAGGCDSATTLVLKINQPTADTINKTVCGSYTWHGTTYTKSGSYTFDSLNMAGCDSLTTLVLKVNKPTTDSITLAACGSYTWHNTTYTKSGTYTFDSLNAASCDSLTTLILKIIKPSLDTISQTACGSYIWHNNTYTKSGSYTFDTISSTGCDSLTTLILKININKPTSDTITQSATNAYTWHGSTYYQSGTYTFDTLNAIGCDSLSILKLTIKSPIPVIISFTPTFGVTGNTITIKGFNFTGTTSVTFGNIAANFKVVNDSIIAAILGGGASGSVSVTNNLGKDSLKGFSYCTSISNPSVIVSASTASIPSSQTSVTFKSSVFDAGLSSTYQWYKNNTALKGAIIDSLTVNGLVNNDSVWVVLNSSQACTVNNVISNKVFMYVSDATITTVAGNGIQGYDGDGASANSAKLNFPWGIAVDANDNLYCVVISALRKINTDGIISTFAGGYSNNNLGDGGLATAATLPHPAGVTTDANGNIYISDIYTNSIRKVDSKGIIYTIAGKISGKYGGYSGDGDSATSAELSQPWGMTIDAKGNLYIADKWNNRIRKVDTNGIISTFAGNGTKGYSGDGGIATAAELNNPEGVALDSVGNLFIIDSYNNVIRKVSVNGIISTIAGNGIAGYSGDGGMASIAELNNPSGLAIDAKGNIYISDWGNLVIRKINKNGIINTVAGNGIQGDSGDGSFAIAAEFYDPECVAVDAEGNLYISDMNKFRVRKVTFSSTLPTTLSSFSATAIDKTIQTNWFTATELNTSHFIIQHSTNGNTFTDIGSVKAIGTGVNKYEYTDVSPVVGTNYYRLKSVDKDGAETYSKVVTCELLVVSKQFTIVPNPARDIVTVKGNHISLVQVIDNMGRVVNTQTLHDATNPQLSVGTLSAGLYHLRIQTTDGKVSGVGLVKE